MPLSNVAVLRGGIANMILNLRKRYPIADCLLINWDFMLIIEPSTMAGALISAKLNK